MDKPPEGVPRAGRTTASGGGRNYGIPFGADGAELYFSGRCRKGAAPCAEKAGAFPEGGHHYRGKGSSAQAGEGGFACLRRKGQLQDKVLPLVRKTMGCPMVLLEEGTCSVDAKGRECSLLFREAPAFSLTTAAVYAPAEEGRPTGDAAAFLETERGNALLALSDGMGTGEQAAKESRIAIELLEQFTEAGFDRALAVRMINSALLLRRGEETYATLDICHVNLFDGHAEFIKLGAVASFIWRRDRIISLRAGDAACRHPQAGRAGEK